MVHICGANPIAPPRGPSFLRDPKRWLGHKLWRKPGPVEPAVIDAGRAIRPPRPPAQRTPYWTLDVAGVRLVALDTGIRRMIDPAQGDWLARVSRDNGKAKILLTGSPLYRNGEHNPCPIEGRGRTVDEIVDAKEHNYVAVIAGEFHNYQRYPVSLPDGRTIQHVVAGGGGAFMDPTYKIPNLDELEGEKRIPVREFDMKLYPTRGRSLARLTQELARKRRIFRRIALNDAEAAALLGNQLSLEPVEHDARKRRERGRYRLRDRVVTWIFLRPLPGPGNFYYDHVANYLDWDTPRLYKSFLRVDVDAARVRIRCFSASGCGEDENDPPLVDEVAIALADK
jgi:hypothetical protein